MRKMAGAFTTLKLTTNDHQTLKVLLQYLGGKVSEEEFRAVLNSQGRRVPKEMTIDKVINILADQLALTTS